VIITTTIVARNKNNNNNNNKNKEEVENLTFPEKLADDAIMVPVDMRGVEGDFEDVELMLEELEKRKQDKRALDEVRLKTAQLLEARKELVFRRNRLLQRPQQLL